MINFDDYSKDKKKYRNANGYIMHPCRMIVSGSSGTGKTNAVLNLMLHPNYKMDYDRIYLYAKDMSEDKYQFLIRHFTNYENEIRRKTKEPIKIFTHSDKLEDVPLLKDMDKRLQNLVIFDDWTNESPDRLKIIKDYFTMGRKFNCTTVYICHSWYACPKMFRLNTEYAMIFRLPSRRELRELYQELGTDIERDQFFKAYNIATNQKHEFFLLDKKTNEDKKKYRRNFDDYILSNGDLEGGSDSDSD